MKKENNNVDISQISPLNMKISSSQEFESKVI